MKKLFGFFALFILLGSQVAWAQIPVAIQGLAIDSKGVPVPDGNKNITFFIYDSPDGKEPLWSEQQMIPIEDGIFRVMLGEVNAFDLPLDEKPLWLGMKVDDGEELSPRMQLASSEFTLTAKDGKGDLSPSRSTKVAADRDGAGVNEDEFVTANPDKLAKSANPDIVHNDDVIIIGSLCVGFDCVNGESFGFDTFRLKENNLRIKFDDTSTAASFPRITTQAINR